MRVREILEILQSRTRKNTADKSQKLPAEWTKTRRYLYYSRDLTTEQVIKVVQFLEDVLQHDRELVASVIQSNPRVLRFSVERYLKPTVLFLKNLYGEELFREAVKRNPTILLSRGVGCDAPEDSIVAIENFLMSSLELKPSDLSTIKKNSPWVFQRPLGFIESNVAFWDGILQYSGQTEDSNRRIIGNLIKSYPTLFNLSVDTGLAPKVKFLENECGLSKANVASLLTGHRGAVFCLSVDGHLRQSVDQLKSLLGHDSERLKKCIVAHPSILCLSSTNWEEKLSYFDQIDSMCPTKPTTPLASRIAIRSPTVFSLSLQDNIVPKVEFLAGVWGVDAPRIVINASEGGEDETDKREHDSEVCLAKLLSENPSILTMSLEGNIQPTLNFYNRTGFTCLDDDWNLQAQSAPPVRGRYIASSLFQRLLPRWHFYLQHNARGEEKVTKPALHVLAGSSDEVFCNCLGVRPRDFKAFKEEAVPRLKFSSQFDTWLKTGRPID